MLSSIQSTARLSTIPEKPIQSTPENPYYEIAINVASRAINLERNLNGADQLPDVYKSDNQFWDKRFCSELKGYKELKAYINGKLDYLKTHSLMMMTIVQPPRGTEGTIFRGSLGHGFSDTMFYSKTSIQRLLMGPILQEDPREELYILTPVYNPLINSDNHYDTSRMYKVPLDFFNQAPREEKVEQVTNSFLGRVLSYFL